MGLSTGVIYISEPDVGLSVAQVLGLLQQEVIPLHDVEPGFPPTGVLRVATMHGWSIIMADTGVFLQTLNELSSRLSSLSLGRKIFWWVNQSTSASLLFELHDNGALQRRWSESEGEVLEQYGSPLVQEASRDPHDSNTSSDSGPTHDEWTMLALSQAITGLTEDEHFELTGNAYALSSPAPTVKSWWKLW
jgi:hypothetical protein